ncbi:uncharacterized protein LOC115755697 [Rhodamnia argentea]|uniref:Uncharacterized protein LOC115755697 n=1 Tax=Rhodamnia argentea TaxID=178133 RepID=A0A8B8QUZ6_9MYRT|nr:uncharacterized protein LOC115755697 [Rhodamnia argentea]
MFRSLLKLKPLRASPSPPLTVHRLSLLSLSTASSSPPPPPPIVDALIRAHGFSPESALAVAHAVAPKLAPDVDSCVALFKDRGFTPSNIATILTRFPEALLLKASNRLEPKLELFEGNGVSGGALVHVLVNDPYVLSRSLELQLVPCFNCLVKFFGTRGDVVSHLLLKRGTWVLRAFSDSMEANIDTLRRHGVPDSSIAKMMRLRPRTLSRDTGQFCDIVDEIKGMGFNPSSLLFVHAIITMAGMKRPKWAAKMAVLKKFGWSDDQVKAAFLKQPNVMGLSVEKMEKVLNFFMKGLGWKVDVLVAYPTIFMSSFENSILPRLTILLTLVSDGLLKRKLVPAGLVLSESAFLSRFVRKNSVKAPHILLMYQTKEVLPQFNVVGDLSKRMVKGGDQCL